MCVDAWPGVHDDPPGPRADASGGWGDALADASAKGLRAALGAFSPEDSLRDGVRIFHELTGSAAPDMVVLSSNLWWVALFFGHLTLAEAPVRTCDGMLRSWMCRRACQLGMHADPTSLELFISHTCMSWVGLEQLPQGDAPQMLYDATNYAPSVVLRCLVHSTCAPILFSALV